MRIISSLAIFFITILFFIRSMTYKIRLVGDGFVFYSILFYQEI